MAETAQQTQEPQQASPGAPQNPPARQETRTEPKPQPKKSLGRRISEHPIKFVLFLAVLAALAVGGYRFWNYLDSYETTDDAQVDGDIYAVTSRIAGTIKAVYIQDNQAVKAGQLLVELDPRDYEVALEQSKAALNESQS